MVREFEGKTEKEAIDKAVEELQLNQGEFDVEVVEEGKKGLIFKKGIVRIRVHVDDKRVGSTTGIDRKAASESDNTGKDAISDDEKYQDVHLPGDVNGNVIEKTKARSKEKQPVDEPAPAGTPLEPTETEQKIAEFVSQIVERMGYSGRVTIQDRENKKLIFEIHSSKSGVLIGRKGKNLDALQLLANVYAAKFPGNPKIVLDTENYRKRREDTLRRLALKTADQVRRNGGTMLLDPMNPFERRIIHTTLNDFNDIETDSEGDGLYKQVRVIYRKK